MSTDHLCALNYNSSVSSQITLALGRTRSNIEFQIRHFDFVIAMPASSKRLTLALPFVHSTFHRAWILARTKANRSSPKQKQVEIVKSKKRTLDEDADVHDGLSSRITSRPKQTRLLSTPIDLHNGDGHPQKRTRPALEFVHISSAFIESRLRNETAGFLS